MGFLKKLGRARGDEGGGSPAAWGVRPQRTGRAPPPFGDSPAAGEEERLRGGVAAGRPPRGPPQPGGGGGRPPPPPKGAPATGQTPENTE